jgi:hypothetical protein
VARIAGGRARIFAVLIFGHGTLSIARGQPLPGGFAFYSAPSLEQGDVCIDGPGRICEVGFSGAGRLIGGSPISPDCAAPVGIGSYCIVGTRSHFRWVGLGEFSCLAVREAIACKGVEQIVQRSAAGTDMGTRETPLSLELPRNAAAKVVDEHLLPLTDAALVMEFAPDRVRPNLLAQRVSIAGQEVRSDEEVSIPRHYEIHLCELGGRRAQVSAANFNGYASDPCSSNLPAEFPSHTPTDCATLPRALLGTPSDPTSEDFNGDGAVEIDSEDILAGLEAPSIASQASAAIRLGFSIAAATMTAQRLPSLFCARPRSLPSWSACPFDMHCFHSSSLRPQSPAPASSPPSHGQERPCSNPLRQSTGVREPRYFAGLTKTRQEEDSVGL